ncbi:MULTISPECIES: serine--tRNA ligase [Paenibacillaceae]|uniref:Serine--tRNA ligase n=2 Tax=Paenibacillaceae TaxID=186822 RepID=A0A8J4H1V8_9BACL|nr:MULTISPECIES: serine--tRNA ligase [Paenibacillaceae]MDT9723644.1 serine--tRNA ligase [Xylanibacillus composti]MUG66406.1 serine--tRNA ligase [Paenibacillus campinasensis]PAK53063.1 serine--tRNA ligase [Paenibacillus sp. 7541]GIQ67887.1 serine--tRNA ligase [Xylanibacillus composti]
MLDIKWIRQNQAEVQAVADQKGISLSISQLVAYDDRRRSLLQQLEQLRQDRNRLSQEISGLMRSNEREKADRNKQQVKEINQRLSTVEEEHKEVETHYRQLMLHVPNVVSPDTPAGSSDHDNVEVRGAGEPTRFDFEPKDHVALGELHQMIDIPRGVKIAGSRNYYLTGMGALLHRAVQQLALDVLIQRGFTLLEVPLMVRTEALVNTAHFPLSQSQTFRMAEEDKWLVGTSEVPLVSYYDHEIVDVTEPIRLAAISTCFRNEVGSAGKDVHGLYRLHQFSKVEQVILCEASLDTSEQLLQEITANAEEILSLLELPYRVMAVCTGDMSQKTYKQWDIETWMPSRQAYGETHSASNLLDFQARRSNIRYRNADGKTQFCYTLNNTAIASPRILIPLLENHQQEDGSIRIPEALRRYMQGLEFLKP